MKPIRPYFRTFKDYSEFFFKSKQSIVSLQQLFEMAGVFNTPATLCNFLKLCRLKINTESI